ncbi:acyltransferase [Bermanella sp. WJH001]|uniref:acyltransferase n=1 Tax=Bermanella sp. WJH001 TaxID=3048005 RepID=UPI0024BEEC55|nr:acyltransferase [Bermanella sp. WJH001]
MDAIMLNKIRYHMVGVISAIALVAHTMLLGVFLFAAILPKLVMPQKVVQHLVDPCITFISSMWLEGILWWINWVYQPKWNISGADQLNMKDWYLLTANHQSWVDIFVLYQLFHKKAPFVKFFIKKELLYVPIVGQAWWALDFPFMRRYSKEFLAQHPEKAGDDIKETQKACEKFSRKPSTVMNFLEGTRFTSDKHKAQKSPYKHLLKPKAGGIAFTIQALGDKFNALSNATIVYPGHTPTFWDMMCGRIDHILVEVNSTPIPAHFSQGDYLNDPALKEEIQNWVTELWQQKDLDIERLLSQHARSIKARNPQFAKG